MDIHRLVILNCDTTHSLIKIKKTANIKRNYVSLYLNCIVSTISCLKIKFSFTFKKYILDAALLGKTEVSACL